MALTMVTPTSCLAKTSSMFIRAVLFKAWVDCWLAEADQLYKTQFAHFLKKPRFTQ
ncbi:hypothetical protein O9992_24535 [Vibrio lentus]|nr:hypothetical protein [Vibrio lentus]